MANNKLYIVEAERLARDGNGHTMAAIQTPAQAVQNVDIGVDTAQSAAFSVGTYVIEVSADSDCCIRIGSNPTAVQGDWKLFAGQKVYYGVKPGDKIAVIQEAP